MELQDVRPVVIKLTRMLKYREEEGVFNQNLMVN